MYDWYIRILHISRVVTENEFLNSSIFLGFQMKMENFLLYD